MICIAAIMAIAFMVVRLKTRPVCGMLAKTAASVAFVLMGFIGIYQNCSGFSEVLLLGLVLGLVGDIVLEMKLVDTERSDYYFLGGTTAFGLGHIAYLVALLLYASAAIDTGVQSEALISVVIAVVASAIILFSSRFMNIQFGKFIIPVAIYTLLLTYMTAFSIILFLGNCNLALIAIGMLAFLLSDMTLSTMYFGGKADSKELFVICHVLYYGAQICIASFIFIT
jgi:uncharacterized membrane protein YhhN